MLPIKIFLSVGRTSNSKQEEFVKRFEEYCQAQGLLPQTVGRTYFSSLQPLEAVRDLMKECSGSAILAYERLHLVEAVDRRGSPNEKPVKDLNLPTIWNQIEATMAYAVGHPLLVLVEDGLKSEGLFETGYDWYVKWLNLEPTTFEEPEFVGIFADWKRRVEKFHAAMHPTEASEPAEPTPTPPQRVIDRAYLSQLRQLLDGRLSEDELRVLCFDLQVEYDNLQGSTKALKTMNLLLQLERTRRIEELIQRGQQLRPDVSW